MSVSYVSYYVPSYTLDSNDPRANDPCGICLGLLKEGKVTNHDDSEGSKHPFHEDCIKSYYLNIKNTATGFCPFCFKHINAGSLFSWREKVVVKIQSLASVVAIEAKAMVTSAEGASIAIVEGYVGAKEVLRSVVISAILVSVFASII